MKKTFAIFFIYFFIKENIKAIDFSFQEGKEEFIESIVSIKKITVIGNKYLGEDLIVQASELPFDRQVKLTKQLIKNAIKNIINRTGVENVTVQITNIDSQNIEIELIISEYHEIEKINISGIKNSDEILESIKLHYPYQLRTNHIVLILDEIKKLINKKESNIDLTYKFISTEESEGVSLNIFAEETKKKNIYSINFLGNYTIPKNEFLLNLNDIGEHARFTLIRNIIKQFRPRHFFSKQNPILTKFNFKKILNFLKLNLVITNTKFDNEKEFEIKNLLIKHCHSRGYLDAKILNFNTVNLPNNYVKLNIELSEGKLYKLRNIIWRGNRIFNSNELNLVLNARLGETYNPIKIKESLEIALLGNCIKSLYDNSGYLNFNATCKEIKIDGDQVDVEIKCNEGEPFSVDKVVLQGNYLTFDNVMLRAIRTFPGDRYNCYSLIRSYRELMMLALFDMKKAQIVPIPSSKKNFVNMLYMVKENPKFGLNFTLSTSFNSIEAIAGISCNNVSILNLFKLKKPLGAGQSASLDFKKSKNHRSISLEFLEPVISEKVPYMFDIGFSFTDVTNPDESLNSNKKKLQIIIIHLGMGNNIKFVDHLSHNYGLHYKYLFYKNQDSIIKNSLDKQSTIDGLLHDISMKYNLYYDSTNERIFPSKGIKGVLTVKSTLPYSLFSTKNRFKDFVDINQIKWAQYFQYTLDISVYKSLFHSKFVGLIRSQCGLAGDYSNNKGVFKRFIMGGSSDSSSNDLIDRKHIILRGLTNSSLPNKNFCDKYNRIIGGLLYTKITGEIFYPLIDENIIKIISLIFIEVGDVWNKYKNFTILSLKPTMGFGFKVYMSAILRTTLNFDFGYPILIRDRVDNDMSFGFSIGMDLN